MGLDRYPDPRRRPFRFNTSFRDSPHPPAGCLTTNRELYVPELQEVVRPHPHFMLFATQNPPGVYAGRKTLSRCGRAQNHDIVCAGMCGRVGRGRLGKRLLASRVAAPASAP